MERRPLGRDFGLSIRMAVCLALLVVLYAPAFLWIVGMGYAIRGAAGAGLMALAGVALVGLSPYLSELLALSLARAKSGDPAAERRLRPLVERLCGLANLPPTRLRVMPTDVPNAFSAGRSPSTGVIVVTRGLLARLDDEELEAVLAHELSHLANRDAFVMTMAAAPAMLGRKVLWGFVSLPVTAQAVPHKVAAAIAVLYLAPVVFVAWIGYAFATLLVMSITRYREYVADRGAATLTGAPEALMSALQKIAAAFPLIPERDLRDVTRMNAFFVVPAAAGPAGFEVDPLKIFPTHPPLEKRLERLAKLAREMGRPRGLPQAPAPVSVDVPPTPPRRNPHALASFFLAVAVWGMLAGLLLAEPDVTSGGLVWLPLLGSLALFAGVFLALQGIGRASAGASGMGYAVTGLVLLLGPWVLGAVLVLAVGVLAVLGIGPVP
jgi:heat shock protein HtpX